MSNMGAYIDFLLGKHFPNGFTDCIDRDIELPDSLVSLCVRSMSFRERQSHLELVNDFNIQMN